MMEGVTLGRILQWTNGEVVGILGTDESLTGVSTDSRTVRPGELFVALKGPAFDGHAFVEQALARGARAALVEREWARIRSGRLNGTLLAVDDPLLALGAVAREYRRGFRVPVVGVVGSAGKTTTKEMIAAVLARRYRVLRNAGNENNEIGVPRALLQLSGTHEAAVLEMAARKPGDIQYLCGCVQPTVGVLLNVGTAHLEFFGSVEGVAKAKGELLDCLDESSTALVNADDCVLAKEAKRTKGRLLGFSLERESRFRGEGLVLDQEGRGHFSLQNYSFHLGVPGRHNVYNALAAAAVGRLLEVPWGEIQETLAAFQPLSLRSEVVEHQGARIVNDSYNANPESVAAALALLRSMQAGRRIAVLGDMLELGPQGPELHARIGRQAVAERVDLLLATGPLSVNTVAAAREAGMPVDSARHYPDREELVAGLRSLVRGGDLVLVKASRGMKLDEVVIGITR
jgi:UDP-N-acetylmuramoyl-tripeptide--D-alanyl-D-alanine ligase